jgi:hypothetical protein
MIPIIMSTSLWLSQKNILWTSNGNTIVWKIKIFCVMKNWKIMIFFVLWKISNPIKYVDINMNKEEQNTI